MLSTSSQKSKSRRMMLAQREGAWDPDTDLNWSDLAFDKPLLPIGELFSAELQLTASEKLVLSQFIGLMAAQAISKHESVLDSTRVHSWDAPAAKRLMNKDLRDLGQEFFKEEQKHAQTFARYVSQFSEGLGISEIELAKILPDYDPNSWMAKLLVLNSKLGGRAIWWLVMLTEEESVDVFRTINGSTQQLEPLYFNLHRLHFQEEIRHMSYAPLMLRFLGGRNALFSRFIARFDFIVMYFTHLCWVATQGFRLRSIRNYTGNNEFLMTLKSLHLKAKKISTLRLLKLMYAELPWFRQLLLPMRHQSIRAELKRSKSFGNQFLLWVYKNANH